MKFEFVEETDLILNTTLYYTKQEGVLISGSINADKDKAYSMFEKLSNGIPLRTSQILETKTYQKSSKEE